MGITSFLHDLETHFLNELKDEDIPSDVDVAEWNKVEDWFRQAFGQWFLDNREKVLSWEWVQRGWADYILQPSSQGKLQESYRVKPEFLQEIDAWLQDQID